MGIEFAKAYKNYERFEQEREESMTAKNSARSTSGGLLSPKQSAMPQKRGGSELDKVADYVQQIRKHRMKIKNGK